MDAVKKSIQFLQERGSEGIKALKCLRRIVANVLKPSGVRNILSHRKFQKIKDGNKAFSKHKHLLPFRRILQEAGYEKRRDDDGERGESSPSSQLLSCLIHPPPCLP